MWADDPPGFLEAIGEFRTLTSTGQASAASEPSEDPIQRPGNGSTCELEGTPGKFPCGAAPWEAAPPLAGHVLIPRFVDHRIPDEAVSFWNSAVDLSHSARRQILWATLQVAVSGAVPEEALFESSGDGPRFTLRPKVRSVVPLQRIHVGPRAIPNNIADIPTHTITSSHLLAILNFILGSEYTFDSRAKLEDLIDHIKNTTRDVGEAYGTLRTWWFAEDLSSVRHMMEMREADIARHRQHAIKGSCIHKSRIPPRRIWDLYSNRILSSAVMPLPEGEYEYDEDSTVLNYWTVSHSWVAEEERLEVWTKVNAELWPVPLPRATTLEHIRVELLNMGAEYVWLDVLCLRQHGKPEYEAVREEEWKLDVPTIGYAYSEPFRPCITYFNGLGLPLDTSLHVLQSERHWFNRVWTMQEAVEQWLPGGLTGEPLIDGTSFFARLENLIGEMWLPGKQFEVAQNLKARYCTNALDRIASLAYHLRCGTLPLYRENIPEEDAWRSLLKHMHKWFRTHFFLQYAVDTPFGLWVTWKGFLESRPALPTWHLGASGLGDEGCLVLQDSAVLYTDAPGSYYHSGRLVGPCHFAQPLPTNRTEPPQLLSIVLEGVSKPVRIRCHGLHGVFLPNISYMLVGIGDPVKEHWVVVEVVGERQILVETSFRVWERRPALEAVKWAVIRVDVNGADRITQEGYRDGCVAYLEGEQALKRSRHAADYVDAFAKMRADADM